MAAFTRSSPDNNKKCSLDTPSEPVNGSSAILQEQPSPTSSKSRRKRGYGISKEPNEEAIPMRGSIGTTTRALSFTKVITGKTAHHSAFCCRLALPRRFCEEHNIQKHVTMTDSTGRRLWHMRFQLRRSSKCYTISNGWREFSFDHSLEIGDVLVFTLLSSSHFGVEFAASDGLGGSRAMHPTRDGDEYPWKINYSRLACLSWQQRNIRHSQEREENVTVTASPDEEIVLQEETLLQPSEAGPIQGMENNATTDMVAVLFPKKLNPPGDNLQSLQVQSSEAQLPKGGQKHSVQNKPIITLPNKPRFTLPTKLNPPEERVERFCQCKTVMVDKHKPRSLKLPGFTHLECKNPDGTTYLQIFDSDSEIGD